MGSSLNTLFDPSSLPSKQAGETLAQYAMRTAGLTGLDPGSIGAMLSQASSLGAGDDYGKIIQAWQQRMTGQMTPQEAASFGYSSPPPAVNPNPKITGVLGPPSITAPVTNKPIVTAPTATPMPKPGLPAGGTSTAITPLSSLSGATASTGGYTQPPSPLTAPPVLTPPPTATPAPTVTPVGDPLPTIPAATPTTLPATPTPAATAATPAPPPTPAVQVAPQGQGVAPIANYKPGVGQAPVITPQQQTSMNGLVNSLATPPTAAPGMVNQAAKPLAPRPVQ